MISKMCVDGKHEWCANRSAEESHCQCACHTNGEGFAFFCWQRQKYKHEPIYTEPGRTCCMNQWYGWGR